MTPRLDCPHRPPCPGCPRFGEAQIPADAAERANERAQGAGLPKPPVHALASEGHRHRARLAVRGRASSPKVGLFQKGSHRIADIPRCSVHHPLINETATRLREAIRETGVAPYADRPHRGALRYMQCVVERSSERVQVVLVGNGDTREVLGDLPEAFARRLGDRLQGLFFNAQPERSNAILGPKTERLLGDEMIHESIAGSDVFYPPAAFGQNHLPLFEQAVERIRSLVPSASRIAEFHCGVGAIGLGLLAQSELVRFNERSPEAWAGLERGLAALPEAQRRRAVLAHGAASQRLDALDETDIVIVDPPRQGLEPELTRALIDTPPKRIIYLACGEAALHRDVDALTENGQLRLAGFELFDFFPWTEHVESLVWLDRTEN